MKTVEAVLVNYKRPANIPRILEAFKNQTVPCTVTLIDCAPGPEWQPQYDSKLVDRYIRLQENHGGYNRYLFGFLCEQEFCYFHDDDMLPGIRVLEHFLETAESQDFGVLGQMGRKFPTDGSSYNQREILRSSSLTPVDLIVRAYFVRSRNLHHLLRLKWKMPAVDMKEDDMLLSCSIQMFGGLQSYLTPLSNDPETSVIKEPLNDQHALTARADHLKRRDFAMKTIMSLGWPNSA